MHSNADINEWLMTAIRGQSCNVWIYGVLLVRESLCQTHSTGWLCAKQTVTDYKCNQFIIQMAIIFRVRHTYRGLVVGVRHGVGSGVWVWDHRSIVSHSWILYPKIDNIFSNILSHKKRQIFIKLFISVIII